VSNVWKECRGGEFNLDFPLLNASTWLDNSVNESWKRRRSAFWLSSFSVVWRSSFWRKSWISCFKLKIFLIVKKKKKFIQKKTNRLLASTSLSRAFVISSNCCSTSSKSIRKFVNSFSWRYRTSRSVLISSSRSRKRLYLII